MRGRPPITVASFEIRWPLLLASAFCCIGPFAACGDGPPARVSGTVREQRTGTGVAGAIVSSGAHSTKTDARGRFALDLPSGRAHSIEVRTRAHCAEQSTLQVPRAGASKVVLHVREPIVTGGDQLQVGFDRDVRLEARSRCARGPIRWEQIAGPRVKLSPGPRAGAATFKTLPIAALGVLDERPGVVAFSRTERAEYRFRAHANTAVGPRSVVVRVVAAPASTGLFQVPTGADMYLNPGSATSEPRWVVQHRPTKSRAELDVRPDGFARLRPDVFGTYQVALVGASEPYNFVIQAGGYEAVPRDCGRAPCHPSEDERYQQSPHALAFRRGMDGELGREFAAECWSCHATGVDAGIPTSGLDMTAARSQWHPPAPAPGAFDAMPRRVRRHAQVWCSACHGPGRIVPPDSRWQYGAKYASAVCARCHDAPSPALAGAEFVVGTEHASHGAERGVTVDPDAAFASTIVREWRASAMARFATASRVGAAPARDDPALTPRCATCHAAQSFVEWHRRDYEDFVPSHRTVEPITCPTCHEPHEANHPSALRAFDAPLAPRADPEMRSWGSGAICVACHSTGGPLVSPRRTVARPARVQIDAPHAPQADMLVGRGARTVTATIEPVHRGVTNTCVGCHMARPNADHAGQLGGHTFAVSAESTPRAEASELVTACAPCHGDVTSFDQVARSGTSATRDWDGDGSPGTVRAEADRATARARERVRAAVTRASLRDRCPTPTLATDVVSHRAELVLAARSGDRVTLLGDCDGDGRLGPAEDRTVGSAARLPARLRDAAWDLAFAEEDRSRGLHNPEYLFRILAAVERAAR